MRRILLSILAPAIVFASGIADSASVPDAAQTDRHQQAVELARNGDFETALALLADLRAGAPEDLALLYDETVILNWAGFDERTLANAESIDIDTAPDYVLETVGKAARNTGRYDEAIRWYRELLRRAPDNLDARLGLAFSHADAGSPEEAYRLLAFIPGEDSTQVYLDLAEAYVHERAGRLVEALASYQRIVEYDPRNTTALRGMALVLRDLLLPSDALALAEQHPGILDKSEIEQLEADVAAMAIREGAEAQQPVSAAGESTEDALARIDTLLADPAIQPEVRRRLEYDRIVALTDRGQTAEAIVAFEALDGDRSAHPVYVLVSASSAYLGERRPTEARRLLEHALRTAPDDLELRFQLFWVYSELQQYADAQALADGLLAEIEAHPGRDPEKAGEGSPAHLRAAILVGLSRAYADQLDDAQEHFESMLTEMPHNTEVRLELASLYRWRGWTDRSLREYRQVLAVDPDFLAARIGAAHVLLDAHEYDDVERELAGLEARYGGQSAVRDLARRWQLHNLSEARIDARFGKSSGTTFGEDQYDVEASWYSRPLENRYRVLVFTNDAYAEFPEGNTHRRRAGIGIDYRYGRWHADAALTKDRSGGDTGITLSADYRFDDHLEFAGRFETESMATPLRGYRAGVSSRLASASARYAPDESTSVGITGSAQDLSDGNAVQSLFVNAATRIVNRPRYKVFVLADLYTSARERDDVAYFSPRHDFSWTGGLRADWMTWRRYDLDVSQTLRLEAGQYNQADFSPGAIWAVEYRISLSTGRGWYTNLGVRQHRAHYDGNAEDATFFTAGIEGRF